MGKNVFKSILYCMMTFALFFCAFGSIPANAQQAEEMTATTEAQDTQIVQSGLVEQDGMLYFYKDGARFVPQKAGAYSFGGKAYLFTSEGAVVRYTEGKITVFEKEAYFVTEDNSLASGLQSIGGRTYHFDEATYASKKGWVTYKDGKKRCFGSDGVMLKGLEKVSGKYYFFASDGTVKTGWVNYTDGRKRYFGSDGVMLKGLEKVSGKYYFFDSKGVMKTGWVKYTDGRKRYFGSDGVMYKGLKKIGKKYYYFNSKGLMKTGWIKFKDGKRYFGIKSGEMYTGIKKISGKRYYFNKNGFVKNGWIKIGSDKYYFSPKTNVMATKWTKIGKKEYYFYSDGKMAKNAIVDNYYVLSNGTKATDSAVSYAVRAVKAATDSEMTGEQKLKACYDWIVRNFYYERDYTNPATLKYNWVKSYAEYAFRNRRGNCYKYASAMGYCAEILGYEAKIAYGKISSGRSKTNHGWTEITIGGKTYIYDTVQEDYYRGNFYKRTYKNYPKTLYKSGSKAIVLS